MVIVICDDSNNSNAHSWIRRGWARALSACGHDTYLWNIDEKSAIDIFDDLNPDLFWGLTYRLERGTIKAITERPNLKVLLTGSDWSDYSDNINLEKYPILSATHREIKLVEDLNNKHKIDYITCHYHENDILKTHHHWRDKLGITIHGLPLACDIADYVNPIFMPELESDISHISGYWPYKAQIIDKWFLPLCSPDLKLNIKIFGNRPWPTNYCGMIDNQYAKNVFKSAKLNINLSEPHAHDIGGHDLNEKCFKVLAGRNSLLSDYTPSLAENFFNNGEVEFAKSPAEFKEKALSIISGDLIIDTEKGYQKVMNSETYFHRCVDMFTYLGMHDEALNVERCYHKIRLDNDL